MDDAPGTIVAFHDVSASFHGVQVLQHVSLTVERGEVHAITGAPGSGKSTLAAVLSGERRRFAGEVEINSRRFRSLTPSAARSLGVAVIRQRLTAIPSFTVGETIFPDALPLGRFFHIRERELRDRSQTLLRRFNTNIDPRQKMKDLTYDQRCVVALAAACAIEPDVLIFDEITSAFPTPLLDAAHRIMDETVARGGAVLFITSRPKDVFDLADRVSVLHEGSVTSTRRTTDVDKAKLVDLTYALASSGRELRETNAELQRYKAFNEDIIRSLPVGVVILDSDRTPYIVNGEAARILGYDETRVMSFSWLLAQLADAVRRDVAYAVEQGIARDFTEVPHGDETILNIRVLPFTSHRYDFLGTILLFSDVTHDFQMRSFMTQAEKTNSIALLAAGIAHEINNPLAIVLNHVDMLKRHSKGMPENEHRVEVIDNELHRIRETIRSLLSFSHPDEGEMTRVSIGNAVTEAFNLMEHRLSDHNLNVDVQLPSTDATIVGNENQLIQLVINLVSNALDATGGSGTIAVELEIDFETGFAVLHVSDSGPGIPPGLETRVFDPFVSTKKDSSHAGLGLALCRHIAASHRGTLQYHRHSGITDFVAYLPIA